MYICCIFVVPVLHCVGFVIECDSKRIWVHVGVQTVWLLCLIQYVKAWFRADNLNQLFTDNHSQLCYRVSPSAKPHLNEERMCYVSIFCYPYSLH